MIAHALIVRPAREADLAAFTAIYGEAVLNGTASFELSPPDEAEMTRRFAALMASGHPWLTAEHAGQVAGYAYAGPYRPRPAYRHTVENSVYVARGARGLGVGRALLSALIAEAEARGFRQMVAVIGDSASLGSIALHKALGFAHVGTLAHVGHKHGRWLDTVLMQRTLGRGDTAPPERP